MKIKNVKVYNYLLYEDVDVDIGDGVFFIVGENKDDKSATSNGSGKSTFCQAIVWCLFGDVLRKGFNLSDLIGRFDDHCYTIVEVEKNGQTIRVERYREHPEHGNDLKVFVDGEDKSYHKKKDTQSFIFRKLGVSEEIVYQAGYFDDSTKAFVELTPAQLRDKITELLEVERFSDYLKSVRRVRGEEEQELDKLDGKIPDKESHLQDKEDLIESLEERIRKFDDEKREEVKELKSQKEEIIDKIEKKLQEVEGKQEVKKKRDELQKKKAQFEDEKKKFDRLKRQKKKKESNRSSLEDKFYKYKNDYEDAKNAYQNLTKNDSGECNYCGNDLGDSETLQQKADKFEKKRDEKYTKWLEVKTERAEVEKEIEGIEEEIEGIRSRMDERSEVVRELDRVKRKFQDYQRIEKEILSLNEDKEKKTSEIKKKKEEKSDFLEEQLAKAERKRDKLEKQIENLYKDVEEKEKRIEGADVLREALKTLRSNLFNGFVYQMKDMINQVFERSTGGDYRCHLSTGKDDRLEFTFIQSSKDQYMDYWAFSKGERARIEKTVAIALNKLVGVDFMIDDEGFDGFDGQGVKDLAEFISNEFDEQTVFFVSHREAVKNMRMKGVRNINITKENERSTVEVV